MHLLPAARTDHKKCAALGKVRGEAGVKAG
jgi:hypothetical protein